jgi:RHS repeat-associated protein
MVHCWNRIDVYRKSTDAGASLSYPCRNRRVSRQRLSSKQVYSGPSGTETTHYIGGLLEKVVVGSTTDWRHYIAAEGQVVAIVSRQSSGTAVYYPLEDNQGSGSTLTSGTGSNLVRESFNAFGLPRDGTDWDGAVSSGDQSTINGISRRGYTGHSMLGAMGLIHMNGRVQDAVTGRFLSPDPNIPHPGFTQSFNRYAYVNNNPLTFIDPSGFCDMSDNFEEPCPLDEVTITGVRLSDPTNWLENYRREQELRRICALLMAQCNAEQLNAVLEEPLDQLEEVVVTATKQPQGKSDSGLCRRVYNTHSRNINLGPAEIDTPTERMLFHRFLDQNHDALVLDKSIFNEARNAVLADHTLIRGPRMVTSFTGTRTVDFGRTNGSLDFTFGTATGHFRNGYLVGVSDKFDFDGKNPLVRGGGYSFGGVATEVAMFMLRTDANLFCGGSEGFNVSVGDTQ